MLNRLRCKHVLVTLKQKQKQKKLVQRRHFQLIVKSTPVLQQIHITFNPRLDFETYAPSQTMNANLKRIATRSPAFSRALGFCLCLHRVLIGALQYCPLLWLATLITLKVWFSDVSGKVHYLSPKGREEGSWRIFGSHSFQGKRRGDQLSPIK